MKPSPVPLKPQKVTLEKDTSLGACGSIWQIRALYRFYGWEWVADVRGHTRARKIAALVRKGL